MDLFGLVVIPDLILWILLFVIGLYIYGTWPFNTLSSLGYPGPKPRPFIGNMDIMLTKDKPYGWCDGEFKGQYGDIVALYEGRQPTLVVYDTEMIKEILVKDFTHFSERRRLYMRGDLSKSLLDLTGAEWRRVRGLISPFFSTSKLKRHIDMLNSCTETLIENLDRLVSEDGSPPISFDLKEKCGAFTMDSICLTAFGIKVDSNEDSSNDLVTAAKKMFDTFSLTNIPLLIGFIFPFTMPLLETLGYSMWPAGTMETMNQVIIAAIEERKKNKKDYPDFVQTLIHAHDEEVDFEAKEAEGGADSKDRGKALTDTEIMAHGATFFLAGYDTTATALSFLLYNLAAHPDWQDKVYNEVNQVVGNQELTYDNLKHLTLLEMCIDESLRLYPPLLRVDRRVTEDVTCLGNKIPKECLVVIPVHALHHDPDLWTDPETFNPERFEPEKKKEILNSYIYHPFGTGPRGCVGMRLAVIEIKIAAARVIQRYKWKVSDKTQQPITLDAGFFTVAKGGLWMNIERRAANKES